MNSVRFPGKMLASFRGHPLVSSVINGIARGWPRSQVIVLTSTQKSDDELAKFVVHDCGVAVFRGELDDVVARFQACLEAHPCDWFVRISGDSPLMDGMLVRRMTEFIAPDLDVVTNVKRRTFPPGQSVECVRSAVFASLDRARLTAAQREHVTAVFYDTPLWKVRSIVSREPQWASTRLVVDTIDDLHALEAFADTDAGRTLSFSSLAEIDG